LSDLFNTNYKKIIQPIKNELELLDKNILCHFETKVLQKNEVIPIIKEFLSRKSKRIRPCVIFLFAKALGLQINNLHNDIAITNELIHNATLIHDDIIDCALIRRGEKTLNFQYDSKLAVLAGDYLLANAIEILNGIDNKKIQDIHTKTISYLINGELSQYFKRFKLLTIEEYIEKSKNKTARLFEAGILSVCMNLEQEEYLKNASNFALNFGIAFQIHNDLKNINNMEKTCEDLKNGDYSAPIIFFAQQKNLKSIDHTNKLLENIKNSAAVIKTQELIKEYINKAIENIAFIEDNLYKEALIELCRLYTKF